VVYISRLDRRIRHQKTSNAPTARGGFLFDWSTCRQTFSLNHIVQIGGSVIEARQSTGKRVTMSACRFAFGHTSGAASVRCSSGRPPSRGCLRKMNDGPCWILLPSNMRVGPRFIICAQVIPSLDNSIYANARTWKYQLTCVDSTVLPPKYAADDRSDPPYLVAPARIAGGIWLAASSTLISRGFPSISHALRRPSFLIAPPMLKKADAIWLAVPLWLLAVDGEFALWCITGPRRSRTRNLDVRTAN